VTPIENVFQLDAKCGMIGLNKEKRGDGEINASTRHTELQGRSQHILKKE